jgi:DNA-binding LytR/AlgR family response regulator
MEPIDEGLCGQKLSILIAMGETSSATTVAALLAQHSSIGSVVSVQPPGYSGFAIARALPSLSSRLSGRMPLLVFVSADHRGAVEAFEHAATDYLVTPISDARFERCVTRLSVGARSALLENRVRRHTIAVSLGSTTHLLHREDVRFVHAQGDYVRLHTSDSSYLVRVPISELDRQWAAAGFLRIHRSYLVAMYQISRAKLSKTHPAVFVHNQELPVSRRALPATRRALRSIRLG